MLTYKHCCRWLLAGLSCFALLTCRSDGAEAEYLAGALRERIVASHLTWGSLGLNTAVKPPNRDARKIIMGEQTYEHGLGMHANGEVVVDLACEFTLFDAEVGLQRQDGKSKGSVVFQVFVDDEIQFDSGLMKENDPPKKVHVSVKDAEEMRLVVTDGGDGINSDVANWANAQLTRDPQAKRRPPVRAVDVAPFARVVTSDPKQIKGTAAGRVEEFPAKDLSFTEALLPEPDGSSNVPIHAGAVACIGLEWREFRFFRDLGLQFADPSRSVAGVKLQRWIGMSSWQGQWETVDAKPEKTDAGWIWRLNYDDRNRASDKVRWLIPASDQRTVVTGLTAYTTSSWKTAPLRLEGDKKAADKPIQVEIYNGDAVAAEGASPVRQITWDPAEPLRLAVRYARTGRCKTDQTVLRFKAGDQAFGVSVEDVLQAGPIYVPTAGLFVVADSSPIHLEGYREQIRNQKSLLARVREMPEQTFPRAIKAVHLPIQDHGPMMLSLACDERKFVAFREGSLGFTLDDQPSSVFDGTTDRRNRGWPYRLQAVFGDGINDNVTRHLDGEWLPIPVTTVDEDGVLYRVRSYVAPIDDHPVAGAPEWLRQRAACVVEYTVENTRAEDADVVLMLSVRKTGSDAGATRGKPGSPVPLESVDGGVTASVSDRLLTFIQTSQAAPLRAEADSQNVILVGKLPAKAKARAVAYLPAWNLPAADYSIFQDKAPALFQSVKQYWQDVLAPGAEIELPDRLLTNVIRASQVHIMLAAGNEENGKRVDVWTSADRYGALESEAHPVIRGMDMMGQQDFARRGLDFFLARYNDAGFLTTGYTVMGSGWHLWTLAEFVDRSQDLEWFKKVSPKVARLCHWIVRQREKTKVVDACGEKAPNYGLTPPGVVADWARFTNTTFQAAHYCTGLREAARVLAKIGYPDAKALAADADDYRQDILHAYRWTQARSPVIPRGDGTWVPAQPPIFFVFGEVGGFYPGEDGSRAWCKNAMAHHLMVNRVMDPNGEEAAWVLDIMEGKEFLRAGLAEPEYSESRNHELWFDLGGFNKCQPYYRRSVELYALRDDVKPFIRGYFNTIPSLLSLENLSFWEHFHNHGGWNKTHETGWFLCQTRIMLLQEREDQLWLAPFVTRNWLKQGMTINVQNAPTNFGRAGYRIESDVDHGAINAVIDPPTVQPPERIVLRLRHPEEKPIKSVTVNGRPHEDFDPKAETVTVFPGSQRLTVHVQY